MSLVARLLGAVLLCALLAPAAHAQNPYRAEFQDQCCYLTLESGEYAGGQFFQFKNVGSATWVDRNFKLAISDPYERDSPFRHPSWYEAKRPAKLPVQAVAPGQSARFAFNIQAPRNVGVATTFREPFQLVAEGEYWVENSGAYLDYTVLPSLPPSIAFSSVPPVFNRGGSLDVAAEATDNRAVQQVEFTVAGKTFTVTAPETDGRTFKVSIPGGEVPPGTHTLIAKAVDRVGNFASSTATVTAALADRDGDGVLEDRDCNDFNGLIRPGAPDRPANGIDEDCDGVDALAKVTAPVSYYFLPGASTTRVTTLRVREAPAGAKVELRCSGRRCPFKTRAVTTRKGGTVDVRKRYLRSARFRAGSTLEVRVLVPGQIAKVLRFKMRKRRAPVLTTLCMVPGEPKPKRCA